MTTPRGLSLQFALRQLLLAAALLGTTTSLALAQVRGEAGGASGALAAPPPALHVIPFPGTPDASPKSRIIFSGLHRSDLSTVEVTGTSSASYQGRLSSLPDDAGTAFIPSHRFTPGETVSVAATLTSGDAGTTIGAPGAKRVRFHFKIATPPPAAPGSNHAAATARARSAAQRPRFHSAPKLDPPAVSVSSGPAPGPEDIFIGPWGSGASGPMILSPRGQLVWFHPLSHRLAFNVELQHYRRSSVLTWWQGVLHDGHGIHGQDMIFTHAYRPLAVLHAGWGYTSDVHEFQLTSRGTALIDAYKPVQANLSSVGGPSDATMYDCVIQELDVRTGVVLWEWHALGHVPLTASYIAPSPPRTWDPFHLNSIQQLPHHRLLVSFANTYALYVIDQRTGRVIWTIGGKDSNFTVSKAAVFSSQHDARLSGHILSLFDEAVHQAPQSSAKVLRVDFRARTVSLVHRYQHHPPLVTGDQGSAQILPDRDVFVGWGNQPDFSEYSPGGHQIFSATLPLSVQNYRAFRFPWTGFPRTRPAVAASRQAGGGLSVYASWNGATEVASWRVLGGRNQNSLKMLAVKRRTGFETRVALSARPRYIAVRALDGKGRVLGRSRTIRVAKP